MIPNGASTNVTSENREDYVHALCDYRLKEAVRVQFDRFAKGFWRVMGQSSIERVVEAEELRVMVQGDEAPLDWDALQDVCAYEGFGEVVGGADEASTPAVNDDMSVDSARLFVNEGSEDPDASDSSGEPLFGAVTEPRVIDDSGDAATPEGGDESPGGATEGAGAAADGTDAADAAAAARQKRNPRDVPVVKALWAAVAAFDETLQRDFLMFVTGSKTAPMGGLGALRPPAHASFKIQRAGPDSDALPTSHTCFNTLLLPEYDPPEKVAKLLEYAVREGHEGFALE